MYRIIIVWLLITVPQIWLSAQSAWHAADSASYAVYLEGDWKKVLEITDKSLREGTDFYYLRVRAGKAAYELKKYRLAVLHFAEAYKNNPNDDFVNYWYYYALQLSGRREEAANLASRFDQGFAESMNIRQSRGITGLLVESSVSSNRNFSNLSREDLSQATSYIGYRNLLKQQFYKGIGLDHRLGSQVHIFHGFSHLGINRLQSFGSPFPLPVLMQESRSSQLQYYLQGRFYSMGGWVLTASFTLLGGEAESGYYTFSQTGQGVYNNYLYKISDYVQTVGFAREFPKLRAGFSLATGNINDFQQLQAESHVTIFPFSNPDFYLISGLAAHLDGGHDGMKYIFSQQASVKARFVWITGSGSLGTIRNFSALNGYLVYNMPEDIKRAYSLALYFPLLEYRLGLTLRYQLTAKEGTTFDYSSPSEFRQLPYTFQDNNILISLKWNL